MDPMISDWRTGGRNILPCQPSVDDRRITENFRMDNPITEDHNGSRKFYLEYDMSQFKPEEITVKTSVLSNHSIFMVLLGVCPCLLF
jgi:hypothetical protein